MKWKIDEDYTIETDAHAFCLRKAKKGLINPETGKPVISEGSLWFPTIKMCLKKYKEEALKPCNDAISILNKLEEIDAKIEALEFPTFAQVKSAELSSES